MGRGSSKAGGGGSPATPKQTATANQVLDKINNRKRSYTTTLADAHGAKVDANTVKGDVLTTTININGRTSTYTFRKTGNNAWKSTDANTNQNGSASTSEVLFSLATIGGDIKLIPKK